jgi:GTP-binding protein HflX
MTLDPTTRRLRFPREGEVLLSDTVGFLSDLPADLVAAFRATLEELEDSDLLLHVVDAADEGAERKLEAVSTLLDELDLGEIPQLVVLNKADVASAERVRALRRRTEGVVVSARRRDGLEELVRAAEVELGLLVGAGRPAGAVSP